MSCYSIKETSQAEYEELCKLDVLGPQDPVDQSQTAVFEEFKHWCETTLPWKANHIHVSPEQTEGNIKRLHSLNRKLQSEGLTEECGAIN